MADWRCVRCAAVAAHVPVQLLLPALLLYGLAVCSFVACCSALHNNNQMHRRASRMTPSHAPHPIHPHNHYCHLPPMCRAKKARLRERQEEKKLKKKEEFAGW